jgi:hypothetical protein
MTVKLLPTSRRGRAALAVGLGASLLVLMLPANGLLNSVTAVGPRADETREQAAVERHIRGLKAGRADERVSAAKRLGECRARRAVPALIDCLRDSEWSVRAWSAWALGEIGDRSAVLPLIDALEDQDKRARWSKSHFESKAIPDMCQALEKLTGEDFGLNVEKWLEYRSKQKRARSK